MRKNILFLLHIPPPIHGSSMVGKWIKNSVFINHKFNCSYINLLASQTLGESGKVTFSKLIFSIKTILKVFLAIIKNRPELCYIALTARAPALYRDLIIIFILKIFHIKRIYHLHNKGFEKASKSWINRKLYNFAFKNTTVIILSEYLFNDIKRYVDRKNTEICPNGIPDIKINPIKSTLNEKTTILFLSNLIESKGVFVLLKSLSYLKQKGIEFSAIFVGGEGDISAKQFSEKLKNFNLENCVNYLGKKYDGEKEAILNTTDIFAFPTYFETFGLVNLEAMQHKIPIITTPEGGIPSVVQDKINGFIVPQKNSELLAIRLEQLINNKKLREEMGAKGREIYEKKFTLKHFETRLGKILEDRCMN